MVLCDLAAASGEAEHVPIPGRHYRCRQFSDNEMGRENNTGKLRPMKLSKGVQACLNKVLHILLKACSWFSPDSGESTVRRDTRVLPNVIQGHLKL